MEVMRIESELSIEPEEVRIYGLTITVDEETGAYRLSFKHTGDFRLRDYKEVDLEVDWAYLTKRN